MPYEDKVIVETITLHRLCFVDNEKKKIEKEKKNPFVIDIIWIQLRLFQLIIQLDLIN